MYHKNVHKYGWRRKNKRLPHFIGSEIRAHLSKLKVA